MFSSIHAMAMRSCLQSFVNLIRVVPDPFHESVSDFQEVTQLASADLIELLKSDLVIEVNHPVAVACQGRQQAVLAV
jgi:hypothetical protein